MKKQQVLPAVEVRRWEARLGNADCALHWPILTPDPFGFNAFWQGRIRRLRQRTAAANSRFPLRVTADWQETRLDELAVSGFLEIAVCTGYADWRLERISGTFLQGRRGIVPLGALLTVEGRRRLPPLTSEKVEQLSEQGETPFFPPRMRKEEAILQPYCYYLTGEGLAVWFPQESIAPRPAGLPTVFFSFDEIRGLLRFSF
ncbi:MAG: DUF3298 domain-containing protein [Clostridia bacterium]|nr:DUF3298 domain-containing protein [Clostridia bacterium]